MEASVFATKLRVTLIQVKLTKCRENPLDGNAIMNAVCLKELMFIKPDLSLPPMHSAIALGRGHVSVSALGAAALY